MMMNRGKITGIALALLLPASTAHAILEIEITQGVSAARPIAVVPFGWEGEGKPPLNVADIVAGDLARSGRFKPFPEGDMLEKPTDAAKVDFKNWRVLGVENVVIGKLVRSGNNHVIQFQLFDVYRGQQLLGYSVTVQPGNPRRAAHQVSDMIYEKLTGEPGAFSTRVAFITAVREGGDRYRYSLMVADADGENQQAILNSASPIMSPAWSPDGRQLAYVSFENKTAEVYVQTLATGQREAVASRPGLNNAPVFSPDGEKLALVLSSEPGNPDIYVMDLRSRNLTRITSNPAIDTEPAWLPDSKGLVFTSDRGGQPQIYLVESAGGNARRLTFEGSYNTRPRVSPDGKTLAMVHQDRSGFHIAVMDMQTGALRVLTDGRLDESPSFAPNGSMIIYATGHRGRGVLAAVSTDGRVKQRLGESSGDVREPAWSPFPPVAK